MVALSSVKFFVVSNHLNHLTTMPWTSGDAALIKFCPLLGPGEPEYPANVGPRPLISDTVPANSYRHFCHDKQTYYHGTGGVCD